MLLKHLCLRSIAPIDALPRIRVPFSVSSDDSSRNTKVSKPLDISPIVADAEKHEQQLAETETETEEDIPPTLALSRERRAELKLAKLADDDKEDKTKKKSRWASWFNFSSKKAKIDARGEHAWVTNKLPKSSYTKKQKTCLANAIYFESRSEPEDGQIAVGQVCLETGLRIRLIRIRSAVWFTRTSTSAMPASSPLPVMAFQIVSAQRKPGILPGSWLVKS